MDTQDVEFTRGNNANSPYKKNRITGVAEGERVSIIVEILL